MISSLTPYEENLFNVMIFNWGKHLVKNQSLSDHYNGVVKIKDFGMSIPPVVLKQLDHVPMMWSHQAVKRKANGSVLEGYNFSGVTPKGFSEVIVANDIINKYDETLPSQLTHGLSFWTVTAGDDNEAPVIISSYDALHATALYDYRHNRVLCGLTIVDVDPKDKSVPTAVNFYAPNGDIVELERVKNGEWVSRRLVSYTGRCCMDVMKHEPDKEHPFGKSVITPAILSLEQEANRQAVRLMMIAELFTAPTRYILGATDKLFEKGGRWEAYYGNILALPTLGPESESLPEVGQFPQGSMSEPIKYIRMLAEHFAAEASIPIHSLLYTEANPASAEAIEASRYDLVESIEKVNRLNGATLNNISQLAISVLNQKPVSELTDEEKSFEAQFKNPLNPSVAATADAAYKIAKAEPGFVRQPQFWRMLGYTGSQIDDILTNLHSGE